jgi:DNA/RNA endonuclease G (NUC1)
MPNITPQTSSLNRGVWKALENYIRVKTLEDDTIEVQILIFFDKNNLKTIGKHQVQLPKAFLKKIKYKDKYNKLTQECYYFKNDFDLPKNSEKSFEKYRIKLSTCLLLENKHTRDNKLKDK